MQAGGVDKEEGLKRKNWMRVTYGSLGGLEKARVLCFPYVSLIEPLVRENQRFLTCHLQTP